MSEQDDFKIPIWVDCDTGHDDAFALLLAAYHPRAALIGASTTFGNAPLPNTTSNTLSVLRALGHPSLPVIRGAAGPLSPSRPARFATSFHGASGLDGVTVLPEPLPEGSSSSPLRTPADPAAAIADAILAQPKGRAWLVATGPLTNVAAALQARPELADHLGGLSVMGGAVGGGFTDAPGAEDGRVGNWSWWAEFNIICDPEAARLVLADPILAPKTTLATLDLTHLVRGTPEVTVQLFPDAQGRRSRVRTLFAEIHGFFAAAYAETFSISDGPPMHDPVAVAAALFPEEMFEVGERWKVDVVLEGDREGQTVLTRCEKGEDGVRVPKGLKLREFWNAIENALEAAERVEWESGGGFNAGARS